MSHKSDCESEDLVCPGFDPQAWRKGRCRHCFRLKSEHPSDKTEGIADRSPPSRDEDEGKLNRRLQSRMKRQPENADTRTDPPAGGASSDVTSLVGDSHHVTDRTVEKDNNGNTSAMTSGVEQAAAGEADVHRVTTGGLKGKVSGVSAGEKDNKNSSYPFDKAAFTGKNSASDESVGAAPTVDTTTDITSGEPVRSSRYSLHSDRDKSKTRAADDYTAVSTRLKACTDKRSVLSSNLSSGGYSTTADSAAERRHSVHVTDHVVVDGKTKTDSTTKRRHSLDSVPEARDTRVAGGSRDPQQKKKVNIPVAFRQQTKQNDSPSRRYNNVPPVSSARRTTPQDATASSKNSRNNQSTSGSTENNKKRESLPTGCESGSSSLRAAGVGAVKTDSSSSIGTDSKMRKLPDNVNVGTKGKATCTGQTGGATSGSGGTREVLAGSSADSKRINTNSSSAVRDNVKCDVNKLSDVSNRSGSTSSTSSSSSSSSGNTKDKTTTGRYEQYSLVEADKSSSGAVSKKDAGAGVKSFVARKQGTSVSGSSDKSIASPSTTSGTDIGLDLRSSIVIESSKFKNNGGSGGASSTEQDEQTMSGDQKTAVNNRSRERESRRERMASTDSDTRRDRHSSADSRSSKTTDIDMTYVEELEDDLFELEDRCESLEKENKEMRAQLTEMEGKVEDLEKRLEYWKHRYETLEEKRQSLEEENRRLQDRLKLPQGGEDDIVTGDNERVMDISELKQRYYEAEQICEILRDENDELKNEMEDVRLEMEEMHDNFRDEEDAMAFRELQKELEATAKNCRILQFKLRKSERRNDQVEVERSELEERVRKMESQYESTDEHLHIAELEEELKMAKEVSVRLHDELEFIEEKRAKYEEENDKMKDSLRTSENERKTLQSQIERIKNEMERLRADLIDQSADSHPVAESISVPASPEGSQSDRLSPIRPVSPMLSAGSRQSSTEHDVAQLMRDLSDCRERELDLKDQLKFAEEEINVCRKKLSELEDENESLVLSLRKISKKKGKLPSASSDEESFSENDERDSKLKMELTEQEMNVLKRKMEEMEKQNETLTKEVNQLQRKLTDKYKEINELLETDPGDGLARRASLLSDEIEQLKWKLIEKDRDIERLSKLAQKAKTPKAQLKKSRSLDSDTSVDIKRQLDLVTQEAQILKDKLRYLEDENEKLISDNNKLLLIAKRRVPSLTKDDPAVENVVLKDKIDKLEANNSRLKQNIQDLEERLGDAAVELTKEERESDLGKTKEKLRVAEEEIRKLREKLENLEDDHLKLLDSIKRKRDRAKSNLTGLSPAELRDEIEELDDEITELKQIMRVKDENSAKLEQDVNEQQKEIDNVKHQFLKKEKELLEELEQMENKNSILSNLLEVVSARIESETSSDLSRNTSSRGSSKSKPIPGGNKVKLSPATSSGTSTESDDVFLNTPGHGETTRFDWERKFKLRIECLEKLLAEERNKARAESINIPPPLGGDTNTENIALQTELSQCKKQLEEANSNVQLLNDRLSRVQTTHESIKENFDTVTKELETERTKRMELDQVKLTGDLTLLKEKEELLKRLDSYKQKTESLYDELQQLQKNMESEKHDEETGGEKSKEQMKKELQEFQDVCIRNKLKFEELEYKLNETSDDLRAKEEEFEKERAKFTLEKNSLQEQVKSRDDSIGRMKDLLQQKETLIRQKDQTISANNDTISQKDVLLKQKEDSIRKLEVSTKQRDNEMTKLRDQLTQKEGALLQHESKVRQLDDLLRQRDDRLREKDEVARTLNNKIRENELKISDMERKMQSSKDKLEMKEAELRKVEGVAKEKTLEYQEAVRQKNSFQKKLDTVTAEREKIGNEMGSLRQQKIALENEKRSLQVEIQQYKDRLHIKELSRSSYESKVVKTLLEDKDKIFSEKHRLQAELETLRSKGGVDRDKLEKLLTEKSKQCDESMELNDKLQVEINILSTKIRDTTTALSDLEHAEKEAKDALRYRIEQWEDERQSLLQKIARDEKVFEIEASALRANYENKVSALQTEIIRLKSQTCHLRTDSQSKASVVEDLERQVELLRRKHETEFDQWEDERVTLQRKLTEMDERRKKLNELLRTVDEGKLKITEAEAARVELQNKYALDKSSWEIQRLELQSRINQLEELSKCQNREKEREKETKPTSRFKDLKARLYTHAKMEGTWEKEKVDMKKALSEAHNLSMELQDQLRQAETRRTNEKQDLLEQHSQQQVDWERDREELAAKILQLEARCQQYQTISARLQHLERDSRHERDAWTQERAEIKSNLEDTRALLALEKQKLDSIVMELRRLRELTPLVEHSTETSSATSPNDPKSETRKVQESAEVRQALDERFVGHFKTALAQLMKLSDDITQGHRTAPSMYVTKYEESGGHGSRTLTGRPSATGTPRSDMGDSDLDISSSPFYKILSSLSRQYTSVHINGTQSAHASRSATPDRPGRRGTSQSPVRKITNYPDAPPSFIITTPKRSQSPANLSRSNSDDGHQAAPASDAQSLSSSNGVFYQSLPVHKRLPLLKKCYSLDTPSNTDKLWRSKENTPQISRSGSTETADLGYYETERKYALVKAWAGRTNNGATSTADQTPSTPQSYSSQTSIASDNRSDYDVASLARKIARQKFYDNYEKSNRDSGFLSWPERKSHQVTRTAISEVDFNQAERKPGSVRKSRSTASDDAPETTNSSGGTKSLSSKQAVKDRSKAIYKEQKEKEKRAKEEKMREEKAKKEKAKEEKAREEKAKLEKAKEEKAKEREEKAKEEKAKKEKEEKARKEKEEKMKKEKEERARKEKEEKQKTSKMAKYAPFVFSVKERSQMWQQRSTSNPPSASTGVATVAMSPAAPSVAKSEKKPFGFLRKSASADLTSPKPVTASTSSADDKSTTIPVTAAPSSSSSSSSNNKPVDIESTRPITTPVTHRASGKTWRVTPV
ncbi:uncharacterized protein LOC141910412 [Tubulanus polymorphus]|uniref:uncharacterized protein LOC141910412 n=1 Tax=Tubulanus polymorphus TaxID=672921 RepID=UPI003DA328F1